MSQNTEQNVRTRDEQVQALACMFPNGPTPLAISTAENYVKEAEARGAEEERAKGSAVAGYIPDNTPNFFAASEAKYTSTALHREPFLGYVPVYYAPANVAALEAERDKWKQQAQYETDVAEAAIQKGKDLEARVRQLEAVLDGIKTYAGDTLAGPVGGGGDLSWFRDGVEETFRRARAALACGGWV